MALRQLRMERYVLNLENKPQNEQSRSGLSARCGWLGRYSETRASAFHSSFPEHKLYNSIFCVAQWKQLWLGNRPAAGSRANGIQIDGLRAVNRHTNRRDGAAGMQ
jgi:hypothetical protein